jgi:hypothetical protein
VPPADEMRFADGQRTLEQVVVSLLNHQRRQCAALATFTTATTCRRRAGSASP